MERQEKIETAYRRFAPMVYRLSFSYMKNAHDTEDVVQETFIRYLQKCPEGQTQERDKAWLIITATNLCRDELRRHRRTEQSLELSSALEAPQFQIDETLEAVLALSDKLKTVVYLHFYEGYTSEEIGRITGRTASAVRGLILRAKKQLRMQLEGSYHE